MSLILMVKGSDSCEASLCTARWPCACRFVHTWDPHLRVGYQLGASWDFIARGRNEHAWWLYLLCVESWWPILAFYALGSIHIDPNKHHPFSRSAWALIRPSFGRLPCAEHDYCSVLYRNLLDKVTLTRCGFTSNTLPLRVVTWAAHDAHSTLIDHRFRATTPLLVGRTRVSHSHFLTLPDPPPPDMTALTLPL